MANASVPYCNTSSPIVQTISDTCNTVAQVSHQQPQQFYQQQQEQQQQQQQHQYYPQEQYQQTPETPAAYGQLQDQNYQLPYQAGLNQSTIGPITTQHLPTSTELARPYRFKQHRLSQLSRVKQEQGIVNRYSRYDTHEYPSGAPYPCNSSSQSSTLTQVSYSQSNIVPQVQSITNQSVESPQQAQYTQQEQQMHLGYQSDTSMTVATQQPGTYYTSSIIDQNSTVSSSVQMLDQTSIIDIQEVPYTEGEFWCSITYHEYAQRIGEKYHSSCRVVSVDGYTQPMCNDRFCIGGISNVNRNQFTEWVRRRIGRGVRLTYVDGEVYVEGLSESSIFVSNPLQGVQLDGENPVEHVSKLTQGCSAKVFSTQQFSRLLAGAVERSFEAVYKLTNCCVIRISFVKGWGRNYKRQSIYDTPCWVEVQLNGPLQWIDKVLRQMRPPTGCGSTS